MKRTCGSRMQASGAFHDVYATDDMVHRSGYDGHSHEAWEVRPYDTQCHCAYACATLDVTSCDYAEGVPADWHAWLGLNP